MGYAGGRPGVPNKERKVKAEEEMLLTPAASCPAVPAKDPRGEEDKGDGSPGQGGVRVRGQEECHSCPCYNGLRDLLRFF